MSTAFNTLKYVAIAVNFVSFFLFTVFESREKIVMVMEHASGGELYDFINDSKLTVQQTKELFQQIVSAVHYIHKVRNDGKMILNSDCGF